MGWYCPWPLSTLWKDYRCRRLRQYPHRFLRHPIHTQLILLYPEVIGHYLPQTYQKINPSAIPGLNPGFAFRQTQGPDYTPGAQGWYWAALSTPSWSPGVSAVEVPIYYLHLFHILTKHLSGLFNNGFTLLMATCRQPLLALLLVIEMNSC